MYGIYRKPGFRRLDLGAWYSFGVFYDGRMNYFRDYQRKGIEFFSSGMRRLSWLRPITDWEFAIWKKPEKFQCDVQPDRVWPKVSAVQISFLWFGFRFWCPRWLANWKIRKEDRKMKEFFANMSDDCGEYYPSDIEKKYGGEHGMAETPW